MAHSTVEQKMPNNLTHTKKKSEKVLYNWKSCDHLISFPLTDISLGNGAEEKRIVCIL